MRTVSAGRMMWDETSDEDEDTGDVSSSAVPSCSETCISEEHKGEQCDCAGCRHIDGVCVDHDSGGGCFDCDGPVNGCDLTDYDE